MHLFITGGGQLAEMTAAVLAARPGVRVTRAAHADVASHHIPLPRGGALEALLRELSPTVVVHLDQPGEESPGDRAGQLQTIDLLGACAAAGVGRVVLRSSTLVYGASAESPALLRESAPLRAEQMPGLQRDYVAIEQAAQLAAQRAPTMGVALLRCAPLVGGGVHSPIARYLRQPRPLTLRGFDPRLQLLHVDDAVVAFALAALGAARGPFNLAAADVISLGRAIRLAGRQPLPLGPLAFSGARLTQPLTGPIRASLPFDPAFLQYACVADTARARDLLGWAPQHTAADAASSLAEGSAH
jgi:UDP-glucose 4-epimerase